MRKNLQQLGRLLAVCCLTVTATSAWAGDGSETRTQRTSSEILLPEVDSLLLNSASNYATEYMRVVLNCNVKAGQAYYFYLPCELDGYYFGADAERTKNIAVSNSFAGDEMKDDEDFPANKVNWVKSDIDLDQIVIMSPGIPTTMSPKIATGIDEIDELGFFCLSETEIKNLFNVTGITDINMDDSQTDNRSYDVTGRTVNENYRGMVIRNSKKYIQQ